MTATETRDDPTLDDLLEAACTLAPELAERAGEFDRARQLPQDVAERLAAAGFYRLCSPVAAGGLGLGPGGMCRAVEALASANASAAWCAFIASTSHLNVATATAEFRELVNADPALIVAGVFSPGGTAVASKRDGGDGWLVNGHWRWGSGCRNASWISGAVAEVNDHGEPVERSRVPRVWFRADEVEILDTWHVTGMRGTGSSDFVARDVWLPAERVIGEAHHSPFADDPGFRFPLFGLLAAPIGAIALGIAQAAIDEVAEIARTKTPNGSRRTLATRPLVHFQFAQEQTRLRAARALLYEAVDELWDRIVDDPQARATTEDRAAVRAAAWHAAHSAVEVVDRMFTIAGGTSVYETSPLERQRRDVHVAVQHMMTGDPVMELAGRVMLGVDDRGIGL